MKVNKMNFIATSILIPTLTIVEDTIPTIIVFIFLSINAWFAFENDAVGKDGK